MTRRSFIWTAAMAAPAAATAGEATVTLPVRIVSDARARSAPEDEERFEQVIWPEALRDFRRCGVEIQSVRATGEIGRYPSGRPRFRGVERGVLNLVLTGAMPMQWDRGTGVAGATTIYEGAHLCVIALPRSQPHRIPYLSVNTCVHELLHALLQDVYVRKPSSWERVIREARVDWNATQLWLFGRAPEVRVSAQTYLAKLQGASG